MLTQACVLARRATLRTIRQPVQLIFPILFPLIFFSLTASGLEAATKVAGFPGTRGYVDFAMAVPFVQGAMIAGVNGGQDIASDIQSGFLNRLAMTPTAGVLLVGQLGGALFMSATSAIVYLLVGLTCGVSIAAGVSGAVVLIVLAITISFAFACFWTFVALRIGSGEAMQGLFPLFLVLLLLSSAFFPRDLIEQDWFRMIATCNPISYLIEGLRSLVLDGWDAQALGQAFGIAVATIAISVTFANRALRMRLGRA